MMGTRSCRAVRAGALVLGLAGAAGLASAAGEVKATAGAVVDGPNLTSALASGSGQNVSVTRTQAQVEGAVEGGVFTALRTPAKAESSSDFEVFGLPSTVPLTFHWVFSGQRDWDTDNASFGITMRAELVAPGFIDAVVWNISYVDGTPATGDFAGVLQDAFSVNAAGAGFANTLPAGDWDGFGSRDVATTLLSASTGSTGSFGMLVNMGMSGDVEASYALRLRAVTVADAAQMQAGAHLLLDDGSQIMISAVPEPRTWAMLLAGVAVMGGYAARRRRSD